MKKTLIVLAALALSALGCKQCNDKPAQAVADAGKVEAADKAADAGKADKAADAGKADGGKAVKPEKPEKPEPAKGKKAK